MIFSCNYDRYFYYISRRMVVALFFLIGFFVRQILKLLHAALIRVLFLFLLLYFILNARVLSLITVCADRHYFVVKLLYQVIYCKRVRESSRNIILCVCVKSFI